MHGNIGPAYVSGALYQQRIADGALYVAGFGRNYSAHGVTEAEPNWSFKYLGEPDSPLTRYLPRIADELGVKTILAPTPTAFNGLVIDAEELTTTIPLERGVMVLRNKDKPADGVLLKPGQAYAISAAGCAVLIGRRINPHTGEILEVGVAHMGLKSVLNDVGGNLLAALGDHPVDTYFIILFAIHWEVFVHEWNHAKDGEKNRRLTEEVVGQFGAEAVVGWGTEKQEQGKINLVHAGRAQLLRLGVPRENIHAGINIGYDNTFYTTRDGSKKSNLMIVARYK